MKKLILLLILSFLSAQSFAGSCPDGSEPVKSVSADGSYFVFNCGGSNTASSSASSEKVAKALAGIDIENDLNLDFFKPPVKPTPTEMMFWYGHQWQIADFNNDGFSDVVYVGAARYTNFVEFSKTGETGEIQCDGSCESRDMPLPALFFGDADGNLTFSYLSMIDNREEPGMSGGNVILLADYNNDSILDIYIGDPGMVGYDGFRDSYYLSQADGTWVESSETHLSHPNFKVYDHGGATGDIDNDGDMDIVITEMNSWGTGTSLWCLMNDGTGFLKKRKCGGADSFAFELADLDGDGDLDALIGMDELEYSSNKSAFTGIIWNDGRGNFNKHNNTRLPMHKEWGGIPEVSASDLDNDGDLDIVYSRVGKQYVGTAIQVIENLGNKKFKDHGIFPLVIAPADYKTNTIANEWNDYIRTIVFRDLDQDGDTDIYLEAKNKKTDGTVLLNNGNFNFDTVKPTEALTLLRDGTDSKITVIRKKHILTDEEQSVEDELAAFEAELAAELGE